MAGRRGPVPNRTRYLIAFTAVCIVAALLLPAMPQPASYHGFADRRAWLGIANFLDVVSNAGFLLAGLAGFAVALRPRTQFASGGERLPYATFFAGLLLTAAGSAYYHLAPDNERLFWDRLPMLIAFMSLIAAQVVDRISARLGLALLGPMLLIGFASVVYWLETERAGAGNVVPYAVLQGYAVVLVLLLAVLQPSRYTRGEDLYWVFAAYVIAKLLELLDEEILALGNIVSGHTLKHLAAAVSGVVVCRMLFLRTLRDAPADRSF
ncbi:MAG: hypothetical protein ACRET7_00220 [Burkholderiales bacterium]